MYAIMFYFASTQHVINAHARLLV